MVNEDDAPDESPFSAYREMIGAAVDELWRPFPLREPWA